MNHASAALPDQLEAALRAEQGLKELRALPTALRSRLLLLVVVGVAVLTLMLSPRADLSVYPFVQLVFEFVLHAVLLVLLSATWLRPLYLQPWPTALYVAAALCAAGLPLFLALSAPAHAAHIESLSGAGADFVARARACFLFGSVAGLPLLALAVAVDRGARPTIMRVLVLLGFGVALGSLALHVHCPIVHPQHLFAGHVTIALSFAVFALIGARLTRDQRLTQTGFVRE